jgi:hypothetical protein
MQTIFTILAVASAIFFIVGMVRPQVFIDKKSGVIPERKVIATGSIFLLIISLVVMANTSEDKDASKESGKAAPVALVNTPEPPPAITHNYTLKDGQEYGYELALTQADKDEGRAASPILMFKYSGDKGNTVQVYQNKDGVTSVIECELPCEFMKIMIFSDGLGHISTDRMRRTAGTVGEQVTTDALNGELDQYELEKNGKKYNVWWDEKRGPVLTQVDAAANP